MKHESSHTIDKLSDRLVSQVKFMECVHVWHDESLRLAIVYTDGRDKAIAFVCPVAFRVEAK